MATVRFNPDLERMLHNVIVTTSFDDEPKVLVHDDGEMQDVLGCFALVWHVAERPTVDDVWKGAGVYRFSLTGDPFAMTRTWREREVSNTLDVELVADYDTYCSNPGTVNEESLDPEDIPF